MKNFFKFYVILPLLLIGAFFVAQNISAATIDSQTITLSSGWNIISTPKVLSSHQFSVAETSDNFDIYMLDPTATSGWQTMQGAGQTEFQPLFAYFINNKTSQNQTLIFNYNFDLTPSQRLFQRTLQPGWNAVGIASPSYALPQGSTIADTNNPNNILSSINSSVGQVIDFTNSNANLDSPSISGIWLSKTIADVNALNDFRELKGYGVFITSSTNNYIGSQNLSLAIQYNLNYTAGDHGSITGTTAQVVTAGQDGTAVTAVPAAGYHFVDWSDGSTANPRTDTNVAANVNVTANFGAVTSGTLTIVRATDSPSGSVVNAASNVTLAKYTLTADGESIKVTNLNVAVVCPTSANTGLRNGALYANGVQVGSTQILNCTTNETLGYTNYPLGSSLIVAPGSPVTLEIRADVYATGSTALVANTDSITAKIISQSSNALGQTSLITFGVPSTDVAGNGLQVGAGGITLAKYSAYTNQTVVAPLTDYKLAHFTLSANATEAVNINTIEIDLNSISSATTNLYVRYGANTTTVKATPSSANTWSVNYTLPAGQTIDVKVYGDVSSSATGTGIASALISGTTASSATTVNTNSGSLLAGQNITFVTGSITSAIDGSTPIASAVSGNQAVTAGRFKFTASNDSYSLTEVKIAVNNNNGSIISSASLRDNSTVLATVPYDSTNNWIYFTGLNISAPANTTKTLSVILNLATPSADDSTTGKNVKISLTYFKALNSQGVVSTDNNIRVANDLYVYKSIPTFTVGSITGQGVNLSAGAMTSLYQFAVSAGTAGEIALKQLKFNTTITKNSSSEFTPALSNFKLFRGSTDITSSVTIQDAGANSLEGTTSMSVGSNIFVVTFDSEDVSPAGTTYTYTLKATPSGFSTTTSGNDSVSTNLQGDSASSSDSGLYYLSATSDSGVQALYTAANHGGSGTAENIIWSDDSATSHNYNYNSSSADWFNGYLINNLPLDAIGIAAQ